MSSPASGGALRVAPRADGRLAYQGRIMRLLRGGAWLLAVLLLALSGCAVNRATATVDPSANLTALKSVHVVQAKDDNQIHQLITDRLKQMGFVATSGVD